MTMAPAKVLASYASCVTRPARNACNSWHVRRRMVCGRSMRKEFQDNFTKTNNWEFVDHFEARKRTSSKFATTEKEEKTAPGLYHCFRMWSVMLCLCPQMSTNVHNVHTSLSTNVHKCSRLCPQMSTNVHKCPQMSTRLCPQMSTNVHKCPQMSTRLRPQMSTHVNKCPHVFVHKCQQKSTNVYKCLQMSTNVFVHKSPPRFVHTSSSTNVHKRLQQLSVCWLIIAKLERH
jgi:hypothetical protein